MNNWLRTVKAAPRHLLNTQCLLRQGMPNPVSCCITTSSASFVCSNYQYTVLPIDASNPRMRIAQLLPGRYHERVKCTTQTVTLKDAHLQYNAISYTRGSNKRTKTVVCNGRLLLVTQKLFVALRSLRSKDLSVTVWIDQLCVPYQMMRPTRKCLNSMYDKAGSGDAVDRRFAVSGASPRSSRMREIAALRCSRQAHRPPRSCCIQSQPSPPSPRNERRNLHLPRQT